MNDLGTELRPTGPLVLEESLAVLEAVVSAIVAAERGIAQLQGARERLLVMASELGDALVADTTPEGFPLEVRDPEMQEMGQRSVAAEIGAATRSSDRFVQRQMEDACLLAQQFPATLNALCNGRISLGHVRVIRDTGGTVTDPQARRRFEAAVLDVAATQTPARTRRMAVRQAEKAQPEAIEARFVRAQQARHVWVRPMPDGMAELGAVLPATLALGIHHRLSGMARAYQDHVKDIRKNGAASGKGTSSNSAFGRCSGADSGDSSLDSSAVDYRSLPELRADLLASLLLTGTPEGVDGPDMLLSSIMARVDVTVPLNLLTQGAEQHEVAESSEEAVGSGAISAKGTTRDNHGRIAAELDGQYLLDPRTARHLSATAPSWNRVVTDPMSGAVMVVDRYRPSAQMRRHLLSRDSRCRFPGCGIRAADLDLDHTHDAARGGPTSLNNLAGLCRRHHMLKHRGRWKPRQCGHGVLEWTSPIGRTYQDSPPTPATTLCSTDQNPPPF